MHIEDVETEALKLDPKARARLAGKLLESLENLSEDENARLWQRKRSEGTWKWMRILTPGVPLTKFSAMFGPN